MLWPMQCIHTYAPSVGVPHPQRQTLSTPPSLVLVCAHALAGPGSFGPCGTDVCTEAQTMETIVAMESNGMRDAGYNYVTLDDCFAMQRDPTTGELFPSRSLFPNGFGPVVERAHAGGFKFGVYTSAGDFTCHAKKEDCNGTCNVGSLGHYEQDAETYSKWSME